MGFELREYKGPWVYIYVLKDPRNGNVRYVGKSVDPEQRYKNHLTEARCDTGDNPYKNNWIQKLTRGGLLPEIEVIDKVPEWEWPEAERYWVECFRNELGCRLTNISNGGDGPGTHSEETKNRIRDTHLEIGLHQGENNPMFGKKLTKEQKEAVSKASIENWNDPGYIKKRSKSIRSAGPDAGSEVDYKGVSKLSGHKRKKTYRARIWDPENKKEISLGVYRKPEDAAKAYDRKAIELFGPDCYTNILDPSDLE